MASSISMLGAAVGDFVSAVPLELRMFLFTIARMTTIWICYRIVFQGRAIRWLSSTLGMSLSTLATLFLIVRFAFHILVIAMSTLGWNFLADMSRELVSDIEGLVAMMEIISQ
jgi:hypothetical protein